MNLPKFSLDEYLNLLKGFISEGYLLKKVSELDGDKKSQSVFLRHDVDLHITAIEPMAVAESKNHIYSTYFVPLSLHFNPLYQENKLILQKIVRMGHEIGLHYDLSAFPQDLTQAKLQLEWEINILSTITGMEVKSICMHNPYTGLPDPFRASNDYVNPHDPKYQEDLLYISDTCRTWRDNSLLKPFETNPPRKVLFNTHPELWLAGDVKNRLDYLKTVLLEAGIRQHREYFEEVVMNVWKTHPVVQQENIRE